MADISSVILPSGASYNLKDDEARQLIQGMADDYATKASPTLTGTPTAPTATPGTDSMQIATTAFVQDAIASSFRANDAMLFKGTIGDVESNAAVTSLPNPHSQGWTYKIITAGTYAGKICEIGDMIICITDGDTSEDDDWAVVQANVDGVVTGPAVSVVNHVPIFVSSTGKILEDSGYTIGTSVPSDAEFTDNRVTQTATTSANWRNVLLHYSDINAKDAAVPSSITNGVAAAPNIAVQPSTGTFAANHVSINANGSLTIGATSMNENQLQGLLSLTSATGVSF